MSPADGDNIRIIIADESRFQDGHRFVGTADFEPDIVMRGVEQVLDFLHDLHGFPFVRNDFDFGNAVRRSLPAPCERGRHHDACGSRHDFTDCFHANSPFRLLLIKS